MYQLKNNTPKELKEFYETVRELTPTKTKISCQYDIELLCRDMNLYSHEVFRIFFLDNQNQVIHTRDIIGSVDHVTIYPRDIFRTAFEIDASALIITHNHPAGCQDASNADWNLTEKIYNAGEALSINLLDHIILYGVGGTSLRSTPKWSNL